MAENKGKAENPVKPKEAPNLDDLLQKYESFFSEEKQKDIGDLATRIDKGMVKAIDEFLINEHGADQNGVPLHYHLGDLKDEYSAYKKADELINHIGLTTLNYMFPTATKEEMETMQKLLKKESHALRGILAAHGFNSEEFKKELMQHRTNIYNSEKLRQFITLTAASIAQKELTELHRDIFNIYNVKQLRPYVQKKYEEKGVGIKADEMMHDELSQHLRALYTGQLGDAYIKANSPGLYKKGEDKKKK